MEKSNEPKNKNVFEKKPKEIKKSKPTPKKQDEDDEGWYFGTNENGEYGKFPSNYVELV